MEQIQEESLIFSQSPLCPLAADVISNNKSIYFYLYNLDFENERLVARSACWVKNLGEAPQSFDKSAIEHDEQPMLPSMFCADDMDTLTYDRQDLEICWIKEGHIAALFHKGEIVSILPSWADGIAFPGYAKYAKEKNKVAWPMCDATSLLSRIEEGKVFWAQEFNSVWKDYNTPYFSQLKELFGESLNCYDIHQNVFPSRLLVTFEKEDYRYAFTVGVGMFSMPNAERYFEQYDTHARTEFAICYHKGFVNDHDELELFSMISGLCSVPWHTMDCIAHGHTLDVSIKNYDYLMLVDDEHLEEPLHLDMKEAGIHLQWIVPISKLEFDDAHDATKKKELLKAIKNQHRNQIK